MDHAEWKERERKTWSSVAEGWRRRDELLRKGAAPVTERMLELAAIAPGHRVLDIASGTGEPAISAARRVGETGRVIGTDLVEAMLVFAREKAAQAGLDNIEFHCADGEALEVAPASFDAATIRWGLMFMPDPEACLKGVHRALKPGGRLVVACWAAPERNPFVDVALQTLARYREVPRPPEGAPGIFAFADPQRLHAVLAAAGFADVSIEQMEIDVIEAEDGAAYWAVLEDLAGPVKMLVDELDQDTRAAFVRDLIETVDALQSEEVLRMRGTTWVAACLRP